jgi:D-beta-D-heptose 7-phosphate kinase/D-beta-D-heptose 1-phosphate adenosyltransferase
VTSQRCRAIFEAVATKRFVVVGDLMLDEFVWGRVSRISPEAPVPVVHVTGESWFPGGAANVARNLHEFAGSVAVAGITGNDAAAERLLGLLAETGIDVASVHRDAAWSTIVKTRIIARQQQVVRVDRERPRAALAQSIEGIEDLVSAADAILVADYGKGAITQQIADQLCALARKHHRILAVDPNPGNPVEWRYVTVIKPNRAEALRAAGAGDDDTAIEAVGRQLLERWNAELLLLTLGEEGMMLFEHGKPPYHTPTRAREVFDVSGAGDTAIAVLTAALSGGAAPAEAAEIANAASGIVVGKLGTAAVTLEELADSFAPRS